MQGTATQTKEPNVVDRWLDYMFDTLFNQNTKKEVDDVDGIRCPNCDGEMEAVDSGYECPECGYSEAR